MKKNYIFKAILLIIPIAALTLMSNAGGKTGGFSGSPGDNGTSCANCHNGGNFGASVAITHNVPITGYELNTVYDVTVNGTSSAPSHGFQLTAEKNSNNSKIGTLVAATGTRLVNSNGNITHSSPGNSSWTFQWRSPSTDEGQVTFYAALNAANGNGQAFDGSDQVVTTNSGTISSLSISEAQRLDFDMFPNPAADNLTIQLPSNSVEATVEFYDYIGRLALSNKISASNNKINVHNLNSGVYILKVVSNDKIGSQRFIKK